MPRPGLLEIRGENDCIETLYAPIERGVTHDGETVTLRFRDEETARRFCIALGGTPTSPPPPPHPIFGMIERTVSDAGFPAKVLKANGRRATNHD